MVQAQDLFTESKSLKFADYLYDNFEYKLAEPEYQRLFFMNTSDSLVASRYFMCNYKLKNYAKNKTVYTRYLSSDYVSNAVVRDVYLRSLVLLNAPELSLRLEQVPCNYNSFYQLTHLMLNSQWSEAHSLYELREKDACVNNYESVLVRQDAVKYKSPGVAFALSAVVPGAGRAYAGYWKDAIFSFVFVSLSAWQAYRGFEKKGVESAYGWIYAGVGTAFYIGDLFGSVKAVNKRNYLLNDELHNQVRDIFISTPFE